MTLKECIDKADAFRPNTFSNDQKTAWINDIEADIQSAVWLRAPELYDCYVYSADQNTELLAPPPYDRIYLLYLMAQISFARMEYEDYANSAQSANDALTEYTVYFASRYHPGRHTPGEREAMYDYAGCWAVKGTTFSVEFTDLPVDAEDAVSCSVVMKRGGAAVLTYEMTDDEMMYEGKVCRVDVPAEDSDTIQPGILRISIIITDDEDKVYESYPPEIVRIKPSAV